MPRFYYNSKVARTCTSVIPLLLTALPIAAQTVTFANQIAPIIYGNCTQCHRTGQVTPFTLMSYSDVKQHAPTIAVAAQSRYMPPWKPETGWTPFRDQRSLTDAQISLIQQWVAQGMPEGDPTAEPPLPTFPDGWQLGTPDLVLTMPAGFNVPPDGPDIYRNFVLHTGLNTEKWIQAIELKPSARGAVHHVLFFSDTTGQASKLDGQDRQPGFPGFGTILTIEASEPVNALQGGLGGWVPGHVIEDGDLLQIGTRRAEPPDDRLTETVFADQVVRDPARRGRPRGERRAWQCPGSASGPITAHGRLVDAGIALNDRKLAQREAAFCQPFDRLFGNVRDYRETFDAHWSTSARYSPPSNAADSSNRASGTAIAGVS